ncbi:MAG: hypothetical protein U9O24_02445 [Campylobacterota bacterium]|nr:hypothetical protein [Campylobacterota bacterium]
MKFLNLSKFLILFSLINTITLVSDDNITDTKYEILHTNNLTSDSGPNDLGPTGDLQFIYTNLSKNYNINIKWELFVNGDPKDTTTISTNPNNIRIDALHLSYIQGEKLKYGGGIQILGNLGGATVQNLIHNIAKESKIPENYPSGYTITPTINFEYKNFFFEENVQLFIKGDVPIIFKNGIIELYTIVNLISNDIYDTGINSELGLAIDCKIYPDMPEFSGYPIRDFKTCTPKIKSLIEYKNIYLFLDLPLINRDIQNSVLGLGYKF